MDTVCSYPPPPGGSGGTSPPSPSPADVVATGSPLNVTETAYAPSLSRSAAMIVWWSYVAAIFLAAFMSAESLMAQPLRDSIGCDSRQAMARQLWDEMAAGEKTAAEMFAFLRASERTIRLQCTPETAAWFDQPRLSAYLSAGDYEKALQEAQELLRDKDYPKGHRAKIAQRGGRGAYSLGRYALAESLYALADSTYRYQKLQLESHRAMMWVNHAWAFVRLGRDQDAECLFLRAQRLLYAENQTGRVPYFLNQADSGLYVAQGNPNLCSGGAVLAPMGPPERAGPWLAACLFLTLLLTVVAGHILRQRME